MIAFSQLLNDGNESDDEDDDDAQKPLLAALEVLDNISAKLKDPVKRKVLNLLQKLCIFCCWHLMIYL